MHGTKSPENTLIIHLSGILVCLAWWLLADLEDAKMKPVTDKSRSLWSVIFPNPQQWTQGTGRNPKRVCSVVHVERNKEPIMLSYRTNSLKVHCCIWHTLPSKDLDENWTPHVGQQRWVSENLKRVSSAAEPGADIGVKVNAMFTTDG